MKKITLILLTATFLFSCSSMESDAKKACDFLNLSDILPEMTKLWSSELSMKANLGDEDSKKEAQIKLIELKFRYRYIIKRFNGDFDEDEFQKYLLENCEIAKELEEMGEVLKIKFQP